MLAVHIIFIFIAMIGCYIIFSKKLNRFYIGATQQGMENRLAAHNSAEYGKSHFTSTTNDWTLFFIHTYFRLCKSNSSLILASTGEVLKS